MENEKEGIRGLSQVDPQPGVVLGAQLVSHARRELSCVLMSLAGLLAMGKRATVSLNAGESGRWLIRRRRGLSS